MWYRLQAVCFNLSSEIEGAPALGIQDKSQLLSVNATDNNTHWHVGTLSFLTKILLVPKKHAARRWPCLHKDVYSINALGYYIYKCILNYSSFIKMHYE